MGAQPRPHDDAERSLGAEEHLREVGPTAARGAPPVVTSVPSASTTSRPSTMSSIFP